MEPLTIAALSAALLALPQSFERDAFVALGATNGIEGISFADVDSDGDVDLIALTPDLDRPLSWVANQGSNGFWTRRYMTLEPLEYRPESVSGADLDGDGDTDLLLTSATPGWALVWHENLGRERFGPARVLVSAGPGSLGRTGDLDGDGDIDLGYAAQGTAPSWLENLGGGLFGAPVVLGTTPQPIGSLELVDLDSDGTLDVLWDGPFSGSPPTWTRSLGAGQFAPAVTIGGLGDGRSTVADVDSDGLLDVVNGPNSSGAPARWARNLGGGAFSPSTPLVDGPALARIALGDFDGDGEIDVVTSLSGEFVQFHRGLGGQAFAAPATLLDVASFVDVGALVSQDLDADGDMDLVVLAGELLMFENVGAPWPRPSESISHPVMGPAVDFDADGDLDVLAVDFTRGEVSLVENLGGAEFGGAETLLTGIPFASTADARDFDGDGDLDLVIGTGSFDLVLATALLVENLGTSFAPPQTLLTTQADSGATVEWLDMDGDGDLDIFATYVAPFALPDQAVQWFRNEGAAGFAPIPTQVFSGGMLHPRRVDIDGDGRLDIVAFRASLGGVVWMPGSLSGTFGSPLALNVATDRYELADLDGDGREDILFMGAGAVSVRMNLGGGGFSPPIQVRTVPPGASTLGAIDVDMDGDADPVVYFLSSLSEFARAAEVTENLGGGTFGASTSIGNGARPRRFESADVDGDGDMDLVKHNFLGLSVQLNEQRFGVPFCQGGPPSSTGGSSRLFAEGSPVTALNDVTLVATDLPPMSFGYLLVADRSMVAVLPPGSQGQLCLGGAIGRLNRGPGEIFRASGAGVASVTLDLGNIPTPSGAMALLPGDTRYFQGWYRDANPGLTSNFTVGLVLEFR